MLFRKVFNYFLFLFNPEIVHELFELLLITLIENLIILSNTILELYSITV